MTVAAKPAKEASYAEALSTGEVFDEAAPQSRIPSNLSHEVSEFSKLPSQQEPSFHTMSQAIHRPRIGARIWAKAGPVFDRMRIPSRLQGPAVIAFIVFATAALGTFLLRAPSHPHAKPVLPSPSLPVAPPAKALRAKPVAPRAAPKAKLKPPKTLKARTPARAPAKTESVKRLPHKPRNPASAKSH